MQLEKSGVYALVALIVIVIVALGMYAFKQDLEKMFYQPKVVEVGDCVEVDYIARYADNGTIFDTSYEDIAKENNIYNENRTYQPLKIYVDLEGGFPPEGYEEYSSNYIKGVLEGLIGMKEGETKTVTIPPEKGYGVKPKIGDILNISGMPYPLEVVDIKENVSMPESFQSYYGNGTTTLYTLRIGGLKEGDTLPESLNPYPCWKNSSVITKINKTRAWVYINPTTEKGENFTFIWYDASNGNIVNFPENKSLIENLTDDLIVVEIEPEINDTITVSMGFFSYQYKVENITSDKINASYTMPDGNKTYREFNRVFIIKRNQTINITESYPIEALREIFSYIRMMDPSFMYSFDKLADKTLIFDLKVEKVYKTSKES